MPSEDEGSSAKRSLRERLTETYENKVKTTKEAREASGTATVLVQSAQFDIEQVHQKVFMPPTPLNDPVKFSDAPILKLKDLVPQEQAETKDNLEDTVQVSKIEFLLLIRQPDPEDDPMNNEDAEWEIPTPEEFEECFGLAINEFTDINPDYLEILEYSSVGWNTGVGMFSVRSDMLKEVDIFREIIRNTVYEGKKFETFPRKMLLTKYALSCYFN